MLSFIAGAAVGSFATTALAFWLIHRVGAAKLQNISNDISQTAEKLVKARKRFGQIANRESLNEARKIANTALKELGE